MNVIDKNSVAKHFSAAAFRYQNVTPVQAAMAESLFKKVCDYFVSKEPPRKILEIGCGTGRLTQQLCRGFPNAQITALDIAEQMVKTTAQSCPVVKVIQCDAETFLEETSDKFDLVISNATFQWFSDPLQAISNARNLLTEEGLIAIASFGQDTFTELRQAFEQAYALLKLTPQSHVVDMIGTDTLQVRFPFCLFEEQYFQPIFADTQTFLRSLQAAGAVNAKKQIKPMNRQVYREMSHYYQKNFARTNAEGIFATYHTFNFLVSEKWSV